MIRRIANSSSMFDLKAYLGKQRQIVDEAILAYIHRFCLSDRMREPVTYAISAGGKLVRPILCIASCNAITTDPPTNVVPVACALEMIHTYSLIHDDLPALDNDTLRRGKPTCHIQFDEATAILAGDALLTMAFEVLSEAGLTISDQHSVKWLQVIQLIARAAGCRGMIEGQAQDLAYEGTSISQSRLEQMHNLKTGAMIIASVHAGALLADGTQAQIKQLRTYAADIGLAFQVVDDILNVKGDPSVLGKAVGTDEARQKNTYPALLGLESAEKYANHLIEHALRALNIFDNNADPLRAIARYIIERNR